MRPEDVRLTDEELDALADEQRKADGLPLNSWIDCIEETRILNAQIKKLVEWLSASCTEHWEDTTLIRFDCWACMEELKKLVGIE